MGLPARYSTNRRQLLIGGLAIGATMATPLKASAFVQARFGVSVLANFLGSLAAIRTSMTLDDYINSQDVDTLTAMKTLKNVMDQSFPDDSIAQVRGHGDIRFFGQCSYDGELACLGFVKRRQSQYLGTFDIPSMMIFNGFINKYSLNREQASRVVIPKEWMRQPYPRSNGTYQQPGMFRSEAGKVELMYSAHNQFEDRYLMVFTDELGRNYSEYGIMPSLRHER